jgi:hypothetical protein
MKRNLSLQEGLESIDRIKLMIGYNPSMTLNENIQTNLNKIRKNILLEVENNQTTGMFTDFIPTEGKSNYFPTGTKILVRIKDSDGYKTSWHIGKGGNKDTEKWVKTNWRSNFNPEGVFSFQTPDQKKYQAEFGNKKLDNIKTWDEFYVTPVDTDPKNWYFKGYFEEQGKPYVQPKPVEKPWYMKSLDWLVENWQLVAEIVTTVVVGILTMGQSLVIQAISQLGVALAFSIDDIAKGDYWTAGISMAIASVPIVGRLAKFGTKAPAQFLAKYGSKLSGLKDSPVAMKSFFEGLSDGEKLLFTRALKQTSGEMKKNVSKYFVDTLKKSVERGTIELSKIPLKQKLWWKELFVEGGVSLGVGLGLGLVKSIEEEESNVEETQSTATKQMVQRKKYFSQVTPQQRQAAKDSFRVYQNIKPIMSKNTNNQTNQISVSPEESDDNW